MRKAPIVGLAALLLVVAGVTPVAAAGFADSRHADDVGDCSDASVQDVLLHGTAAAAGLDAGDLRGSGALGDLGDLSGVGETGDHPLAGSGPDAADGLPTLPVLVAGYSRHDESDPLENDRRASVFEAVTDAPGIAVSAVAERADVSRSTARYHTRVLDDEGLVFGEKIRGKLRYFPADDGNPELTAALADDAAATVLFAVAREGPASIADLAETIDRAPSTVSHHLSRLADADLVERERVDGEVHSRVAPDVAEALADAPPVADAPVGAHADD